MSPSLAPGEDRLTDRMRDEHWKKETKQKKKHKNKKHKEKTKTVLFVPVEPAKLSRKNKETKLV